LIVVDTNVIAYFLIPGTLSDLAEAVWSKDASWAVPRLWRSEMRNMLALYHRRKILALAEIQDLMSNAEKLLAGREYDVGSAGVLDLAAHSGCTAYDCEFVYLADELSVPLITSDSKLLTSFSDTAISMESFISLLPGT